MKAILSLYALAFVIAALFVHFFVGGRSLQLNTWGIMAAPSVTSIFLIIIFCAEYFRLPSEKKVEGYDIRVFLKQYMPSFIGLAALFGMLCWGRGGIQGVPYYVFFGFPYYIGAIIAVGLLAAVPILRPLYVWFLLANASFLGAAMLMTLTEPWLALGLGLLSLPFLKLLVMPLLRKMDQYRTVFFIIVALLTGIFWHYYGTHWLMPLALHELGKMAILPITAVLALCWVLYAKGGERIGKCSVWTSQFIASFVVATLLMSINVYLPTARAKERYYWSEIERYKVVLAMEKDEQRIFAEENMIILQNMVSTGEVEEHRIQGRPPSLLRPTKDVDFAWPMFSQTELITLPDRVAKAIGENTWTAANLGKDLIEIKGALLPPLNVTLSGGKGIIRIPPSGYEDNETGIRFKLLIGPHDEPKGS
ncbi:hypothetical protein [Pseudodesulfovibrio sp. zrk46]|uniref:hypothetical protein n=1 Tax=Pseudodesulfovibrio sp. zrk46 TaxID=2725288 RepID=UPI001449B849|nr:hypothetical protein [Pseudodesulfovibrio sp. zrk46]QJB55962.1 hypothetical protein HFN16_05855 [Pseudodesulfovibrio sp. zrk46]